MLTAFSPTATAVAALRARTDAADAAAPRGRVQVRINGLLVEDTANLITTAGRIWMARRLLATGTTPALISHMAVGTSNTAPAVGQTALAAEISGSGRKAATATRSDNVITYTADWGAGEATATIVEAGLFTAASAGTMVARSLFSQARVKGANDTLEVTWTVTI